MTTLGVIGAGVMGETLMAGLLRAGMVLPVGTPSAGTPGPGAAVAAPEWNPPTVLEVQTGPRTDWLADPAALAGDWEVSAQILARPGSAGGHGGAVPRPARGDHAALRASRRGELRPATGSTAVPGGPCRR